MKATETRLAECISIRSQLQSHGICSIPAVAEKLARHMNDYVKTGASQTFELPTHEKGIVFRVILTSNESKQSGVEMVR